MTYSYRLGLDAILYGISRSEWNSGNVGQTPGTPTPPQSTVERVRHPNLPPRVPTFCVFWLVFGLHEKSVHSGKFFRSVLVLIVHPLSHRMSGAMAGEPAALPADGGAPWKRRGRDGQHCEQEHPSPLPPPRRRRRRRGRVLAVGREVIKKESPATSRAPSAFHSVSGSQSIPEEGDFPANEHQAQGKEKDAASRWRHRP